MVKTTTKRCSYLVYRFTIVFIASKGALHVTLFSGHGGGKVKHSFCTNIQYIKLSWAGHLYDSAHMNVHVLFV